MPLQEVDLKPVAAPIPVEVARFLRAADARIDSFQQHGRVPAFVPSDSLATFGILRALAESAHVRGMCFCEWGCGFGVTADLASLLGFEACGIEIERELVDEARSLAGRFDLPVEFVHGSFIPRGAEARIYAAGDYSWLTTEGDYAYEELELAVSDLDVVFAYPWPDEEAVTGQLFEHYAGTGAILVTYHGGNGFRVRRKKGRRSAPRRPS